MTLFASLMDACSLSPMRCIGTTWEKVLNFSGRIMVIRTGPISKSGRGEDNEHLSERSTLDATAAGFPRQFMTRCQRVTPRWHEVIRGLFFQTTDGLRLYARDYRARTLTLRPCSVSMA